MLKLTVSLIAPSARKAWIAVAIGPCVIYKLGQLGIKHIYGRTKSRRAS